MKKYIFYLIPLFLVGLLVGWYFIHYKDVILTCKITQDEFETYKIKLYSDGRIQVNYYLPKAFPFDSDASEVTDYYTKSEKIAQLTSKELETLKQIVSEMQSSNLVIEKTGERTDSWHVTLKIGFKTYEFYKGDYQNTPLNSLTNMLIELSPIQIDTEGKS